MTGCRIGKVKFKSGGELHVLPQIKRFSCHNSVDNLRNSIDENTQEVAFVVLGKSGSVTSGFSYEGGTALAEMLGSCEILKDDINDYWAIPEEPLNRGA